MKSTLISKVSALCIALSLNAALVGGVAYLFDGSLHDARVTTLVASAPAAVATPSFC